MREPSAGVPLPGGRPEPSGMMLISQAAISAGEIGFPRLGPWAKAALEPRMRANRHMTAALNVICLGINMFHLPRAVDAPARGAVVVLAGEARHARHRLGLAASGDDLSAGRLHIARLIPRAALQDRRPAIPAPGYAEPRESLGQYRFLQCR